MAKNDKKQTTDFTTVVVPAIITATSNKVSDEYKQEVSTKTVYFTVEEEKGIKQLLDLGMTQYTPESDDDNDGKPYFIAKGTQSVDLYVKRDLVGQLDFKVEKANEDTGFPEKTPNYFTEETVFLSVIKVKGGKGKQDFYRINAISMFADGAIQEVVKQNPFENLF